MTDTKHTPLKEFISYHFKVKWVGSKQSVALYCINKTIEYLGLAGIDNPSEWVENMKKLHAKQSKLNLDNLPFKRGEGNYFHCTDYETAVEVVKDLQQQVEQLTKENEELKSKLITLSELYEAQIERSLKYASNEELARFINDLKQLTKQP